jgi:tRNA dimethylallyltransferase
MKQNDGNNNIPLTFIVGVSAVGKTAYALKVAEQTGAEIISCDSVLVYKGMDIGTAKPTPEQRNRVPHHLIDCAAVTQLFTIKDYIDHALAAIRSISKKGKPILIVGGSGFYLKAFFKPVIDAVKIPIEIETKVTRLYSKQGNRGIIECLYKLNAQNLEGLDFQNPRRTTNALKRCLATGKTVLELKTAFEAQTTPFDAYSKKIILLEKDSDTLNIHIEQRVQSMLEEGLIEEVQLLKQQGIESNPSAASAIGYRETLQWLANPTDVNTLKATIIQNTKKLVKKQRTWFRNQLCVESKNVIRYA